MAGIYTRDNFAQLLANAIENAQARRQAHVDREAQRTKENAGAIANFAKALGRTYETWDGKSDEDKLAALQKEREEAVAQQEYEKSVQDKYNKQVEQRLAIDKYLSDPYNRISPTVVEPWDGKYGLDIDMGGYKKIMGGGVYA